MRSLWSGVSGLQAHQVGMDVIGNNIANVNTYGFKYSRTDFANMLSQTVEVATAPQGDLGGQNASQIGLGATVASVQQIFTQGSTQDTGVPTDMAIQGNGFFVVSPDGGTSNFYTRAGDFVFDASGNYVDTSGYAVQGWNRDDVTGRIDTTTSIGSIVIAPGMTMPARATTEVGVKANLTSGTTTTEMGVTYPLSSNSSTNASTYANSNPMFEDMGVLFNSSGKAFNLQNGQGIWTSFKTATATPTAVGSGGGYGYITDNSTMGASTINMTLNGTAISGTIGANQTAATRASLLASLINQYTSATGVIASVTSSGTNYSITLANSNNLTGDATKNINLVINNSTSTNAGLGTAATSTTYTDTTAYKYVYTDGSASPTPNSASVNYGPKQFHTTEDLRRFLQWQAQDSASGGAYGATVIVNSNGQFAITNTNTNSTSSGHPTTTLNIAITSVSNSTTQAATLFTQTMSAMGGSLTPSGTGVLTSQAIEAATHAASIDVYDSLGSKHTLTFNYRKQSDDTWSWTATVPTPGSFTGTTNTVSNIYSSSNAKVMFNSDGSLLNVTPQTLTISFNNGSTPSQQIQLNWGTPGLFDGLTSYDAVSSNGNITQDGYTGGNLEKTTINSAGVIIGTFSNAQSLALAQVSIATFANDSGLVSTGANNYIASANSGQASIGVPGTNGRGTIQSSALEMSNVDLSSQLTEMIVIQRGFQANSKTITTSDQMIQTLLQLKN